MSASFALAVIAATLATSPAVPAAPVQVHGKTAFSIRADRGEVSAEARARRIGQVLQDVVEEPKPDPLVVEVQGDEATFRLGERILFSLTTADAQAEGEASLEHFAQQRKEQLDGFLQAERRRSRLQHAVLAVCLLVFLGFASWLLMRQIGRWTASALRWVAGSDCDCDQASGGRRLLADEKVRGLALVLVRGAQFFAYAVVVYLFLVGGLSLFETARPLRERLTEWALAPFLTVAERFSTGVPTLLLLFLLLVVMQAGWQAINLFSERIAAGRVHHGAVPPELVPAMKLLLRIGLVLVSCLLVAPLLSGPSGELFARLGWLLLEGLGLALLPLIANVAVGVHAILTHRFRTGEFLQLRDGGEGSVAGLDLLHLRLLGLRGEQLLVPHLLLLVQPVRRLPGPPSLEVELPVPLELGPQLALQKLELAAADFAAVHCAGARASVSVLEVGERQCRMRVSLPACPQALRSELLLALWAALPSSGEVRAEARSA